MQTRKQSALEVATGTSIGMVGSWLIIYAVLRTVSDPEVAATVNVALCTVWSVVRGYWVRRRFNRLSHRSGAEA